jgi:RecJ-like exonuclease
VGKSYISPSKEIKNLLKNLKITEFGDHYMNEILLLIISFLGFNIIMYYFSDCDSEYRSEEFGSHVNILEPCDICFDFGHTTAEHKCSICGDSKHLESEHMCQFCRTYGHTTAKHRCSKCGLLGHRAKDHDCTFCTGPHTTDRHQCDKCFSFGHTSAYHQCKHCDGPHKTTEHYCTCSICGSDKHPTEKHPITTLPTGKSKNKKQSERLFIF